MLAPAPIDPWHWWTALQPQSRLLAAALQLGLGLAVAFFGFRLFRTLLALAGFLAGASFGLSLGPAGTTSASVWLLALALGLAGALILWALFRVGALVVGAGLGLAVAGGVAASLPGATNPQWSLLILLVGLVVGALLGWRLQRILIILATAVAGAWGAIVGFAMLVGHASPAQAVPPALGAQMWTFGAPRAWQGEGRLWLLATLVLAVLGAAFQLRDTVRLRNRRLR